MVLLCLLKGKRTTAFSESHRGCVLTPKHCCAWSAQGCSCVSDCLWCARVRYCSLLLLTGMSSDLCLPHTWLVYIAHYWGRMLIHTLVVVICRVNEQLQKPLCVPLHFSYFVTSGIQHCVKQHGRVNNAQFPFIVFLNCYLNCLLIRRAPSKQQWRGRASRLVRRLYNWALEVMGHWDFHF